MFLCRVGLTATHHFVQPTSYLELVRYLGELRVTGEKGHKQLLATVLPRLAQFGVLPAQLLVPQLLQLMSTTDDRQAQCHCTGNFTAQSSERPSCAASFLPCLQGLQYCNAGKQFALLLLCRRLARILYYLLQTLLGAGSAGTPSPTPSDESSSS